MSTRTFVPTRANSLPQQPACMAVRNRTLDFRQTIQAKQNAIPPTKRRIPQTKDPQNDQPAFSKEYVSEAYVILNHINTLTRMLADIRKPYLNVHSRKPLSRQGSRSMEFGSSSEHWADIRHLTNEERDQIDLQARTILKRCSDRVKEMENLEKRRIELVAGQTNPLTRFLPLRLKQNASSLSSDFVAAHRSSITWYLSRRLTEASQVQKDMQEERIKRQMERSRTLGSGAAREVMAMGFEPPENKGTLSWFGDASSSLMAATIGATTTSHEPTRPYLNKIDDLPSPSDDEDDEMELSTSQIQQFEAENANMLRAVHDTLASVQQAESRLMDISALQMELVTHLTRQTEVTDQLYEDAITTTAMVESGNEQLREARRRAKDSRMWILLFLIGASLSLLFLHYY